MYMYNYLYVHVCVYVYVYMYVCIHAYMRICLSMSMSMYTYSRMHPTSKVRTCQILTNLCLFAAIDIYLIYQLWYILLESIEVRESTRVVLWDIQQRGVVRCSLDSCLLLSSFFAWSPPFRYPPYTLTSIDSRKVPGMSMTDNGGRGWRVTSIYIYIYNII